MVRRGGRGGEGVVVEGRKKVGRRQILQGPHHARQRVGIPPRSTPAFGARGRDNPLGELTRGFFSLATTIRLARLCPHRDGS